MCETDFLLQIFYIKGCMAVRVEPPGAHFQWIFYYTVHRCPPLVDILCNMDSVHTHPNSVHAHPISLRSVYV